MEPPLYLTDAATTWSEYQLYREMHPVDKHQAFMRLVVDEHNSFIVHDNGRSTNQPKMLRPDLEPAKTAVIISLLCVDSIFGTKGFAMPYDKTFDESTHSYNVSKNWTYETAKQVVEVARQLTEDARACAKELREEGNSGSWEIAKGGMPDSPKFSVRMVCEQAAAVGSKLLEALTNMVTQKKSMAEMIIQFNLEFDIDGQQYKLYKFEDTYFYSNENGDASLPF